MQASCYHWIKERALKGNFRNFDHQSRSTLLNIVITKFYICMWVGSHILLSFADISWIALIWDNQLIVAESCSLLQLRVLQRLPVVQQSPLK